MLSYALMIYIAVICTLALSGILLILLPDEKDDLYEVEIFTGPKKGEPNDPTGRL